MFSVVSMLRELERQAKRREPVFPPVRRRLIHEFYEPDNGAPYTSCYDCARSYGGAYGFPDLIVPDEVWRRISPTGDQGGLLCPSCIVRRVAQEQIECEAVWASGPFCRDGTARPDPESVNYLRGDPDGGPE